jgi:hypothetical protein
LNIPQQKPIMNFDEAAYAGFALELAESGNYSIVRIFPDQFREDGNVAVSHTLLSPYLQAVFIKVLGFHRVSMRIHSLILYAASGFLIVWLLAKMQLPPIKTIAVISLFLLNPWLVYAGTIARAESVGMFFVYASVVAGWGWRNRGFCGMGASGLFAGLAVYNHAIFLAVACLPFLFAISLRKKGALDNLKAAGFYALGAVLAISILWIAIMLPNHSLWWGEFVSAGASSNAGPPLHDVPIALKHLFSTFGAAYWGWYLAGVLFLLVLLKPTWHAMLGLAWMVFFMAYLLMKMGMVMNYCVQFAVGVPILALMMGAPTFSWSRNLAFAGALALFLGLQAPWNAWRVTAENDWTRQAEIREARIIDQLAGLEPGRKIIGDENSCFPILKMGHRFFYFDGNWALSPVQKERFDSLSMEQATHRISEDGTVEKLK